ncbi:MAG: hypothetical protein RLZZ628_1099 [Bacteroidota bacterium]|jgi:hypothetical protein
MKKNSIYLCTICAWIGSAISLKAQIAINADNSLPHASAMLEIKSNNKGILFPRMTLVERSLIKTPAIGLIIYQTDNQAGLYHYTSTGWKNLNSSSIISYLQFVSKNGNEGYRLYGRDTMQQNKIGSDAIDLSSTIAGGAANSLGATGDYALAVGLNVKASGQFSLVTGFQNVASGVGSAALGTTSVASGNMSFAMGNKANATQLHSFAFGESANASQVAAVAMGKNAIASGANAVAIGLSNQATGNGALALGAGTKATGNVATAMGYQTIASGVTATAIGNQTTASGISATAIGNLTTASGTTALANGYASTASGNYALAHGYTATASGDVSVALGDFAVAAGKTAVALGNRTAAKSFSEIAVGSFNTDYTAAGVATFNVADRAFGVGIGSSNSDKKDGLIVYKDGTLSLNNLTTAPVKTGNRLYVYENSLNYNGERLESSQLESIVQDNKMGYRLLGYNPANYGNIGNIALDLSASSGASTTRGATGDNSVAFGMDVTSSAVASFAAGYATQATKLTDVAIGYMTTASGGASSAFGNQTTASGVNAHAIGYKSIASGGSATAFGTLTTASDINTLATGYMTLANGNTATALGNQTNASGINAFSVGYKTIASGNTATAFGNQAQASGLNTLSSGYIAVASGNTATAFGNQTKAIGDNATAMGALTKASGNTTTALGAFTEAIGDFSLAAGYASKSSGSMSFALAAFSQALGDNAVVMGNTTMAAANRSTAMGWSTIAAGENSIAMGHGTIAKSYSEASVGSYNTNYTVASTSLHNTSDRAFVVGIGTDDNNRKDGLTIYKDGTMSLNTFTAAPATTANRLYILNNQLMYNGAAIGGSASASELEKITQNGNTGYRLLGKSAADYGAIGSNAIDLSYSPGASTTNGATGLNSFTAGYGTTASERYSIAMGSLTTASAPNATAIGYSSIASGEAATAIGYSPAALGTYTTAMGLNVSAKSYGEMAVGLNNTDYTPNSKTTYHINDRAFTIGIGAHAGDKKDGFVLFKNGGAIFGNGNSTQKGKVYIENGLNMDLPTVYYYLTFDPAIQVNEVAQNMPVSLYADNRILASEFNAFSDKRIKDVIGQSNTQADLNLLSKIQITDYTMKDKFQYGDKKYKKVIAQELKAVYPQAVSLSTNFIPNIYKVAAVQDGWVNIQADVAKGDKVRIITEAGQQEIVVEAAEANRFKINLPNAERVFFFGKEVKDFHVVDYEALTTLNISATQALLSEIQQLKAQNTALKTQVEGLNQLKAEVQQIKAALQLDKVSVAKQ